MGNKHCKKAVDRMYKSGKLKDIDRKALEDHLVTNNKSNYRILVIGGGFAGKTTITNYIRYISNESQIIEHFSNCQDYIFSGMYSRLMYALWDVPDLHDISEYKLYNANQNEDTKTQIINMYNSFTPEMLDILNNSLYTEIQHIIGRFNQLLDEGYLNCEITDILSMRHRTTGISEWPFSLNGMDGKIIDVGGPRSERRKWMVCFQDMDGLLFCCNLATLDEYMMEDDTANVLIENRMLFQQVASSHYFANVPLIIVFTNLSTFDAKVKHYADHPEEYTHDQEWPFSSTFQCLNSITSSYFSECEIQRCLKCDQKIYYGICVDLIDVCDETTDTVLLISKILQYHSTGECVNNNRPLHEIIEGYNIAEYTSGYLVYPHLYPLVWSTMNHKYQPQVVQQIVISVMILASKDDDGIPLYPEAMFFLLPNEVLFRIFGYL
eukprot:TRINITY_DN1516_c1_g1_i1.p1 TRINITY_DN1516_c1_g1~~TRINITY_DN1516_c1_g1_i1.p1  ORF type:complete len:437 (+),score=69.38 TRINITY_DN1516_c1_g1_i1:28-1338(+)